MDKMTVDQARKALNLTTDTALAEFFGLSRPVVLHWRKRGSLPDGRAAQVRLEMVSHAHRRKQKRGDS